MKQKIKKLVESLFAKSPRLASFYYAFFSQAMSHEHYTVLQGKLSYRQNSTAVVLRRNTHRLEKGLIMVPRRSVFGLEYIEETVKAFCSEISSPKADTSSLRWSQDVLNRYFNAVDLEHPLLAKLNAMFNEGSQACDGQYKKSPYLRGEQVAPISFQGLYDLSVLRRSVRWYQDKCVPRDLIDQAIVLARLSPSACNRQPFKLKIYDDPEQVQFVSSLPGGTKGFSHNFPMVIAVTGQLRNYYSEADRHIIFIDASLFSMSFILALETLGLSSCIINWPENLVIETKAKTFMNLDDDERIIFLISVGYADTQKLIPYSQKKSLDELRSYNS